MQDLRLLRELRAMPGRFSEACFAFYLENSPGSLLLREYWHQMDSESPWDA